MSAYSYSKEKKQRIILISAILSSVLIIAVSSYFIISPRDADNATGFLFGMVASLFMSMAIIIFIVKSLAPFRTGYKPLIFTILAIIAIQIITFVVLRQLIESGISERLFGNGALSCLSFINRSLTITLLPVLLIVAVLVRFFKIELDRFCILSFTLLILFMVAESMLTTYEWKNFRMQLTQIVKNGDGYIPIEETNLNNNPCRWSWNNTELGLVWAAPDIKAVLLNNRPFKNNHSWQPLDPYKPLILKKYLKYTDSLCLH